MAYDSLSFVNTCAVVYENDDAFGDIDVIPLSTKVSDSMSPSQKIDRNSISHLGNEQQTELLAVLDRYPECFSDVPGLTDVITHSIPLVPGFKPKRLHAYRVPERLKPEVDRQIQEMLDNGIIRPSRSPMASPFVCVLKGKFPWGESQQHSFEELKRLLCKATVEPLYIVDFAKPFNLFVDASLHTVSAVLTQTGDDGTELPVAFSSTKLSQAQMAWSTIEREAYAVLVALKKYRNWIFGTQVTVYSDHNPLQYLIESAPKSAKLMRWSLALQEFSLTFKYKSGKTNVAADCLSRL